MTRLSSLVLALALLSGCAAQKAAPSASAPAKRRLSEKEKVAIEQAYYRAVSAYSEGDYDLADDRVAEILSVSPGDSAALALKKRLSAARRATRP